MQNPCVETSLRGRGDRCETEYEEQVSTHAVVFVDRLCIIHTSIYAGGIILRYSHNRLNSEDDVCDETEDAVWGGKMGASVSEFVVLNDYECGKEG